MLKAAIPYIHMLSECMKEFNPNVPWEDILVKAESKTDEQLLKNIIMPKIWVNKAAGEDLDEWLTMKYFLYFTSLFKKYKDVKSVYIMENNSKVNYDIEELVHLLDQKYSVLKRFLKMHQISIEEKQTTKSYVIPLYHILTGEKVIGTILKDNDLDKDDGGFITDNDLYPIIIGNDAVNRILISAKMLQLGISVENILSNVKNFYFI